MEPNKAPSISKKILCMRYRYWLYMTLFFQYILIVFLFGCVGTRRWVRKGNNMTEWEGGLLSITGSSSHWKDMSYKDAKSDSCDEKSEYYNKDLCNVFEDLYSAGAAYLFFEILALLLIFVWIFQVAYALMEKQLLFMGSETGAKRWWLALLWPGISLLCHIIGIAIWAGVTKSEFEVNCLAINSGKICSTNGPSLSILTIFLYLMFGCVYAFMMYFREGIFKKTGSENKEEEVEAPAQRA